MTTTTSYEGAAIDKKGRAGNIHDAQYGAFLEKVRNRLLLNVADGAPLFTTDVDLWTVYLDSFPAEARQFHNCNACRRFIQRYGGLVTIDETGMRGSAIGESEDADSDHEEAVAAMIKAVVKAKVTGVFLTPEPIWGQPITGVWAHLHVVAPKQRIFSHALRTAGQVMAEKDEDFKNVQRALEEFSSTVVAQAVTILKADALYRSEKVLGPAQWLADLHTAIETHKGRRANLIWRAVATAPAGFCHPRASMIGSLLEDLIAGKPFEAVARSFSAKMNPLQYQRPQAAPSAGNIAQAEKVIAELGAAGSLARRFARLDEIQTIWRPAPPAPPKEGGVFSHLKPKDAVSMPNVTTTAQTMTWQKFIRTLLPTAKSIDLLVPVHGQFVAIVTAANPDAPPIIQWDREDRRNPFSWYIYHGGSDAVNWALNPITWTKVTAISEAPNSWFGGHYPNHSNGAIIVLEGAKGLRSPDAGSALFHEILKSDFHGIRATIEAYSKSARITGLEESNACGIGMSEHSKSIDVRLRVSDGSGATIAVIIDRWD